MNVPEFSFINVDSNEVNDAVLSIKSNAARFDEIPMSFVKLPLSVILPALIFIITYLLVRSFLSSGRPQWCGQSQKSLEFF
jgi:hypothetical protein